MSELDDLRAQHEALANASGQTHLEAITGRISAEVTAEAIRRKREQTPIAGVTPMPNSFPAIDDDRMADARKRVDSASEEAVSLAIDAMHDRALEQAIWERVQRNPPGQAGR